MPGYRLSLPVRVGGKIHSVRLFDLFSQARKDISFAADRDVLRLIVVLNIYSELTLGQIPHMSLRRRNRIIASKEFFDRLHLCR